ncbi:MAG TPA: VOC family protein [Myxococcales bacterium]|nr:VOC family protein [Myxococcales bacterium]
MSKVKAIPEGYTSLTPYLIVKGGAKALDWYAKAFGAKELYRMPMPDGRIGHAEMEIGNARFMLADEVPERNVLAPRGPPPMSLMIYTEDVEAMWKRALAAGGKQERPLTTQFYGDRSGILDDPFGHKWTVAQHVEDVPPEEIERRAKQQPHG